MEKICRDSLGYKIIYLKMYQGGTLDVDWLEQEELREMMKDPAPEPNLTVSTLNHWVRDEFLFELSGVTSWEPVVAGPERCGRALLIHVLQLFDWKGGIPNIIIGFLGLRTAEPQDSWLMMTVRDAVRVERVQSYMYREIAVELNGGWLGPWMMNALVYQQVRSFCFRCGESQDFNYLCENSVCQVCFIEGRRLRYQDDIKLKRFEETLVPGVFMAVNLDARFGTSKFSCVFVDSWSIAKVDLY